nr:short chain dehydrogenase andi [Quercus suber]
MPEQRLWPSFTPTYHHDVYPAIDPTQPALACDGKHIFITGGGRGIGRAIALAFARAHATAITLLGRTPATLEETARLVHEASGGATQTLIVRADILQAAEVDAAMATAVSRFGGVAPDVLINNAGGLHGVGALEDADLEDFWRAFELNVKGPLAVTQSFLRARRRQGETREEEEESSAATVINLSSGAAHLPYAPGMAAYSCSKLAFAKIVEYMHHERPGWRVFNVQPGRVATDLMKAHAGAETPKAPDEPELMAGFAVWLATNPEATALSGRFLWANWDVQELLERKDEIEQRDLLTLTSKGWAGDVTNQELKRRAAGLYDDSKRK